VRTRWLFLVFGDGEEHYAQAQLAALSVLAWSPPEDEIAISTTYPGRVRWLARERRVRVDALDAPTLTAMRGPHDFFWRAKIACILANHTPDANLVYLDSDTYARSDLGGLARALEAGACCMHEREAVLGSSRRRGDRALWAAAGGRTWAGVEAAPTLAMWNAGVVGVGAHGRPLLERALEACDQLCGAAGNHPLAEQFALSLSLGASGKLQAARGWIDHYWGNKPDHLKAINAQLGQILGAALEPDEAAALVRAHPIRAPLHVKRRRWQQWLARRLHLS
jgi:hypothetical protein